MFIHNRLTQHVSGIIMPIVRRQTCIHAVRSSRVLTPQNRSQHIRANTRRSFIQSVLLTMGVMMPETCWVNLLWINIYTCWTLFYYQLMHITLKNAELLRHSKLDKNALTCFGFHRNHLQGARVSAWLKITRLVNSICVKDVQGVVSAMAAYCDL